MKKGNFKKSKPENKRKFYNKSSFNEDEPYKNYKQPNNVFNLASLDKIREEYNNPNHTLIKKNENNSDNVSEEEKKYNQNSDRENYKKNEKSQSDSQDSESQKIKRFDIKLFMMVFKN